MQQGYSGDFYSEQFDCILEEGEDKHISQTDYFWTNSHFIVNTERDIDVNLPNIQKAIQAGATIETMYYVDHLFQSIDWYWYNFDEWIGAEGFEECVEYGEEHGIIFKLRSDAIKYQAFLDFYKFSNFIKKDEALRILKNVDLEYEAERIFKIRKKHSKQGVVCYLYLNDGRIYYSEDKELGDYEIEIMIIDKYHNRFGKREAYYKLLLEKYYKKRTDRLEEVYDELKEHKDMLEEKLEEILN